MEKEISGRTAAVYLRKSRMEEGMNTEEVLSRHRQSLTECAQRLGLRIADCYPEVASGESLYARPQMLRLLEDVEAGRFDAVLCMDLDRLSRGRMRDQGVILDAFRDSGTLIVTPEKIYDLSDEIDDELAEFKTFMSRREYKIINKRLRRGLRRSLQDGCYLANAPYGYQKATAGRRPTLEICEPEAQFVRLMYGMYAAGFGCTAIAEHVNAMGARPRRSAAFSRNSVAKILRNPTYIGKVVWDQKTRKGGGTHTAVRNPPEKWTIVDGLHAPIVDAALFEQVQALLSGRSRPARRDGSLKNPLAGLVRCARCGGLMQRMVFKGQPYLLCPRKGCCAAARFELVERRVVLHLQDQLAQTVLERPACQRETAPLQDAREAIDRELRAVRKQKDRLHELLELGEYDLETYRERMAAVQARTAGLERRREEVLRLEQQPPPQREPAVLTALDAYRASSPAYQNAILRSLVDSMVYYKEKKSRPAAFALEFYLKSP